MTLSRSGPRYVCRLTSEFVRLVGDGLGENLDGEPVTLAGPLGHRCRRRPDRVRRRILRAQTVRAAVRGRDVPGLASALRGRSRALAHDPRARHRPDVRARDRRPFRRRRGLRRARPRPRAAARGAHEGWSRHLAQERRARDRGVARGGDDPRGRDVPLHPRHQRRSCGTPRAPVRRRGRRGRAHARPLPADRASPRRLQDSRPDRALARHRARRPAAPARGAALRARGVRGGREHVPAARRVVAARREAPRDQRRGAARVGRPRARRRSGGSAGGRPHLPHRAMGDGAPPRGHAGRARVDGGGGALRRPRPPGDGGLGRAVGGRRARAHASARPAHGSSGRGQDAHAAGDRRHRAPGTNARPPLRAPTGVAGPRGGCAT